MYKRQEDIIDHTLNDKRITAIGIYAESFNNIDLFFKVLKKAREKRVPIAIVKVGRSKIASETIMSHTGSLSGKEDIYDTIFKQMGATRCNSLSELCETLKMFHTVGILKDNKIAIMGPSGGDMAMTGDLSEGLSINYSKIPKNIYNQAIDHAKIAHDNINCHGVTRSDFILDEKNNKLFFYSDSDAFISKITSNGNQLMHSSFYGTDQYDQSYFVEIGSNNSIYLF